MLVTTQPGTPLISCIHQNKFNTGKDPNIQVVMGKIKFFL